MELQPGVFVSNESTGDWEEDAEVGGEVHMLCDTEGVQAGLSRIQQAPEKPISFKSEMRETIIILEGSVRIEIAGGATLDLKKGDMASLPKGAETLWHVTGALPWAVDPAINSSVAACLAREWALGRVAAGSRSTRLLRGRRSGCGL